LLLQAVLLNSFNVLYKAAESNGFCTADGTTLVKVQKPLFCAYSAPVRQ
jgi:hypothetical protein